MALLQMGWGRIPGIHDLKETIERDPTWGRWDVNHTYVFGAALSGTSRDRYDSGSGVASQVVHRPGLLMEYVNTGAEAGKWRTWVDGGTVTAAGVLLYQETTQAYSSDVDKWFGYILCGGQIRTKDLIVYGRAAAPPITGTDYGNLVDYAEDGEVPAGVTETAIRDALQKDLNFLFDDYAAKLDVAT